MGYTPTDRRFGSRLQPNPITTSHYIDNPDTPPEALYAIDRLVAMAADSCREAIGRLTTILEHLENENTIHGINALMTGCALDNNLNEARTAATKAYTISQSLDGLY